MTTSDPKKSAPDPTARATTARYRRYPGETRAAMLIEAGIACLARGGILAFTVDNICREADASRGLITHHFGSKGGLLAAIYARMYDQLLASIDAIDRDEADIQSLVDATFAPQVFNPDSLKVWLALWGEIANNDALRAIHRTRYVRFRAAISRALSREAVARGVTIDADRVAAMFIALSDGLWLEQSIDPETLSLAAAHEAGLDLLEAFLGPRPPH